MDPILTKQEIAALLQAIHDGDVPLNDSNEEQFKNLPPVQPVDLFSSTHNQNEEGRFPNFDLILDNFCQYYAIALTNELQRPFNIKRTCLETTTFQEFINTMGSPGAIGIFNLPPLKQGILLSTNRKLSYALIEMTLGATIDLSNESPQRALTTLELTILRPLVELANSCFEKTFKPLLDVESSLHKIESNPRLVSITEAELEVLIAKLAVQFKEITGEITLAFPISTLLPIREQLRSLLNLHEITRGSWRDILKNSVQNMVMELTAQSGVMEMNIGQVANLKKGDILPLGYDPDTPLKVLVGNQLRFYAKPGLMRGKKAISITTELATTEEK